MASAIASVIISAIAIVTLFFSFESIVSASRQPIAETQLIDTSVRALPTRLNIANVITSVSVVLVSVITLFATMGLIPTVPAMLLAN